MGVECFLDDCAVNGREPATEVVAIQRGGEEDFLLGARLPPAAIGGFRIRHHRPLIDHPGELVRIDLRCRGDEELLAAFRVEEELAMLLRLRAFPGDEFRVVAGDLAFRECLAGVGERSEERRVGKEWGYGWER